MSSAAVLQDCRLYGIVDLGYVNPDAAASVARAMIDGGVDVIQLRGKQQSIAELTDIAAELHASTKAAHVRLVINDHPGVARDIGAEGLHVGQDDMSVADARAAAGGDCIVGKSTHSVAQAIAAAAEGADYLGFGPLFATPTKPGYPAIGLGDIERVHRAVALPIFCIGGVKLSNLPEIIAAGARRVVIVSEMLQAPDVARYARTAKALLPPLTTNR